MGSLGEELRMEREGKGLTLADVRSSLCVPEHYLEAMEGGETRLVADTFYVVPFLRRYAEFLGKDPAVCVSRYLNDVVRKEKEAVPRIESPPTVPTAWIVTAAAAAVIVAVAVWLLLR